MSIGLTVIGIAGLIVSTVNWRRHEIGVRLALGAQTHEVVSLIAIQGARLIGIGVGLGVLSSLLASRLLSSLLFGVAATDARTLILVAAGVLASVSSRHLPAPRGGVGSVRNIPRGVRSRPGAAVLFALFLAGAIAPFRAHCQSPAGKIVAAGQICAHYAGGNRWFTHRGNRCAHTHAGGGPRPDATFTVRWLCGRGQGSSIARPSSATWRGAALQVSRNLGSWVRIPWPARRTA